MGKYQPLYPHVPKGKEVQFPHVPKGRETEAKAGMPEVGLPLPKTEPELRDLQGEIQETLIKKYQKRPLEGLPEIPVDDPLYQRLLQIRDELRRLKEGLIPEVPVVPEKVTLGVTGAEARREQIRKDLMQQEDTIKQEISKEIHSYQPMGKMSEVGEVLGVKPAKGQVVSTPFGSYVFAKARLPDTETVRRWEEKYKVAEELGRRAATETTFMVVEPGLTTGNIRELEQGRKLKAQGLLSPRELKYVDALEEFWAKYPGADYGVVQPDGSIKPSTRFKPIKPAVAILKAAVGNLKIGDTFTGKVGTGFPETDIWEKIKESPRKGVTIRNITTGETRDLNSAQAVYVQPVD